MANLLYADYNTCYYNGINTSTQVITGYYYDSNGSSMASYYADLNPNTTYTLKKYDTSNRFRIATYNTNVRSAGVDNTTNLVQWWVSDNQDELTFTTGANDIYLVVYYTNNSEYNIRIMLNEGSTALPYEAPTRYFKDHWRLVDNILIHNKLPEPIESNFTPPYPASLWRLDSDDILTLNNEDWSPFPEPLANLTPPYPASMWYLDDRDKLQNALLPDILPLGAFALTTELQEIRLPESLEEIGPEAFYGSAIRSVTIPNNLCTYYATSFPPGCVVTGGHLIE